MRIARRFQLRLISQILFFALIAIVAINHNLAEKNAGIAEIPAASIHAVCPFGGVVSIYRFVTAGAFVQKIHESSFTLMVIVFLSALLFGPIFCGWVCPFGTFQEWIGKLGKKVFRKTYNRIIPTRLEKGLGLLRYAVLVWVVYATAVSAKLVFSAYDPYSALFSFWTSEAQVAGVFILLAVVAASLIVDRPWCKFACPYGALLGLTNLIRPFAIRRVAATCISCGKCDWSCPMNIEVSNASAVRDTRCISCLECTSEAACPIEDTLVLSTRGFGGKGK